MAETHLHCSQCGAVHAVGPWFTGCPDCGGALLLAVSDESVRTAYQQAAAGHGITGYAPVLPVPADALVSLGEGGTPLLPCPILAGELGLAALHIKHEGVNPTGSFKDRLQAVAVSEARALGYDRITCSSTGNAGTSLAAYAAAAGLRSQVLLPEQAPPQAALEVERYGGIALVTAWERRGAALRELVQRRGWAYSGRNCPRPLANPYGMEGYKTIAYEVVRQLGGRAPDLVVMPACGGDGIYGVWRGFAELHRAGVIERSPVMVGCQPALTPSVALAWQSGDREVPAVPLQQSIALSLTDERGGEHTLWALYESGGRAVTVSEDELAAAVHDCGRRGIFAEPAGAAGLAGLRRLLTADPAFLQGKSAVVVMTGSGGRWPEAVAGLPGGQRYSGQLADLPE